MKRSPLASGLPAPAVIAFSLVGLGIGFLVARSGSPDPAAGGSPSSASAQVGKLKPAASVEIPTAISWEERWQERISKPVSPSATRDRAKLLEELARNDPRKALDLALAESNWLVRDQLRDAALRGWAAVAPDDAAAWAMSQGVMGERMRCVSAVLAGAAERPDDAIRVALKVCSEDPTPAGDYGHSLVNALVDRTGNFKSAVEFATKAGMVDRQSFIIDSAYYQWARHEPESAFATLATLSDPAVREAAIKGVIQGSADSDPRKLAEYATTLPEGEDRSQILSVALQHWVGKDPNAVLTWIQAAEPSPDHDAGLSALLRQPTFWQADPVAAMELTDNVTDSVRRSLTKSDVFLQWARQDFQAASEYAMSVQNSEYRDMYLQDLKTAEATD